MSTDNHPEENHQENKPPEPPSNYNPHDPIRYGGTMPKKNSTPNGDIDRVRRYLSAAQIMALISLVVGGVILSGVAIIFAVIGYRRTRAFEYESVSNGEISSSMTARLKRMANMSIALSVMAFALNLIALVLLYPMMIEFLQSSGYVSLSEDASLLNGGASGNSTWG